MRHVSTMLRTTLALQLGGVLAVPATAAAAAAAPPHRRQPIDLGTLGGDFTLSEARAVNDRGQVVGASITAGLGPEHAFLWERGSMRDLGTLGGLTSDATDVNNRGQVVGASATTNGEIHAFLWAGGRMRDLGTLGGALSVARAINDHGRVVGTSTTADGESHAFVWAGGRMRDLGLAAGATANDLNDRGQVTGGVPVPEAFHAYRLHRGPVDLDGREVAFGEGVAINERGQVAGNSAGPAAFSHAVLWSRGQRVDLGTLGGEFSSASGINDRGAVVGQATTGDGGRGFVWRDGVMTGLGVLADGGMNGSRANDINDRGWIVGGSDAAGGDFHAVLWR